MSTKSQYQLPKEVSRKLTFVVLVDLDLCDKTLANLGIPSLSSNAYEPPFISGNDNTSLKLSLPSPSTLPLGIDSPSIR
ncbi:hypothetical protein Hanom_Chr02g00132321 [Helianthus anomalus]